MRKALLSVLAAILINLKAMADSTPSRPNILLIVADDQRFDQSDYMPGIRRQIGDLGIRYDRAYIPTPLCGPSRAGIFTGQYSSRNLVKGNYFPLTGGTIFRDFAGAYRVGIAGKYLNSHDGTPLPEFSYWAVHPYGSTSYTRPRLNVNGQMVTYRRYLPNVVARHAVDFLETAARTAQPWFLTCAFQNPHTPAIAARRVQGRFSAEAIRRAPSYGVRSPDKPAYVRDSHFDADALNGLILKQRDAVYSLDLAVRRILGRLDQLNLTKNTIIVFISDNGVFHGEHGLADKAAPYEEALRVPFYIRFDGLIPPGRQYALPVVNLDLTVTLYDLAGIKPARVMDGVSLRPTFSTDAPLRDSFLVEGWKNDWSSRASYFGLHTSRYLLVENQDDLSELYDLQLDPFELRNLYDDPAYRQARDRLGRQLAEQIIALRGRKDFDLPVAEKIDKPSHCDKYDRRAKDRE